MGMIFFHLEIHSLGEQLDDSRDDSLKEVIDPAVSMAMEERGRHGLSPGDKEI
jgi:hypothetical protein